MKGKIFLIPTAIGEEKNTIPSTTSNCYDQIDVFIVENLRTARRYLRSVGYKKDFDKDVLLLELGKQTRPNDARKFLHHAVNGKTIGLMTEAGCPGIADPGAIIVEEAHRKNIEVIPLVGPSSILLALMASGFNGQKFRFNGYLPIEKQDKKKALLQLQTAAINHNETQIFIEAPYRNNQLLDLIKDSCYGETQLCIATNLTSENEMIISKRISDWKKHKVDIHKQPTVFLIYSDKNKSKKYKL